MKKIKLTSGIEAGSIEIQQGKVSKLIESEPYAREALKVFEFLEDHLCHATFDQLCVLAKEKQRLFPTKHLFRRGCT